MNEQTKTRVEIEKRLQQIIVLLNQKGLTDNKDEEYRSFLGKVGVITSTFGMALRMDKENELYEIMSKYSKKLITYLEDPEELNFDDILKLINNSDLN
jgi:glycerol dehydrogenase-like iron-containing ADH family enzyme